jgi:ABC-type amino acid transport substrate-binding protein
MRKLPSVLFMLACACMSVSAAELASTGVLRATYNTLNAREARFDRRTHMVVGPSAELNKELAKRLNVPFEIGGVEGTAAVVDTVKRQRADIGFIPCDPTLAKDVDFSQAYVEVGGVGQCVIVARGGHMKLDTINRFIDDARASGKLRDIVMR